MPKITHNMSNTPTYKSWTAMKQRCLNSKTKYYYLYGGKGIKIHTGWLSSFENFLEDMGERPGIEYSIHRVDSEGNYAPDNCEWITKSENCSLAFKNKKRGSLSEEHKRKLSLSQIRRKLPEEIKNKMSKSRLGKKHSIETKQRMSEAQKRRYNK
ncbi:hypothetical protein CL634_09415 [bacterium]|nr:hypothetical protein [bacterium]